MWDDSPSLHNEDEDYDDWEPDDEAPFHQDQEDASATMFIDNADDC